MSQAILSNMTSKNSWSKTVDTPDKRKTIRVEEVENGFVISIDIDIKKKDSWEYTCKKYISYENPLSDDDKEAEKSSEKKSLEGLESIVADLNGMLSI